MAVYEQKDRDGHSFWMVDFSWIDPQTGKKHRVRRTAKDVKGRPAQSRTAAEQHEYRLRTKLAAGDVVALPKQPAEQVATEQDDSPLLTDYLAVYLTDVRLRLKPQTIDYLDRTFNNSILPTLGKHKLAEIDMVALTALTHALAAKKLAAKTVNNTLSALRALLSHAADHQKLDTVPRVKWKKVATPKFDFFTFDEAARLLRHAPPLVVVGLRTGMRIGELVALRWGDVSLDRQHVTVCRAAWWDSDGKKHEGAPKNHKTRTIPLTGDALAVLQALPQRTGYVFTDDAGRQLRPTQCKWPLWRAQDAAELRRTGPHVLRHTFASHLVMRGVPLSAVQALMGHSTIQMTTKYAHLAPDHLRAAVDALVLH